MKSWFVVLTLLLIAANFSALYYLDDNMANWFRFGATSIFFLVFLFKYFSKSRLLLIFSLFVICDGLLIFYEIPFIKKIVFTVRILAYLNLILLIAPSLSRLKINFFTVIISLFIICIDLYLLHEMAKSLPYSRQDIVFLVLFYLFGIISLALVATSLSYLNRYAHRKAFFLVVGSLSFVLSDLFFYNSHYLDFQEFAYLDRFANILGLAFLIAFCSYQMQKESTTS